LQKLGQRLEQAQSSYHDAFGKLKSGKGNLIRAAEKVRALGVKPSKLIDNRLIETADSVDITDE
jgi:DNA recombination protein RmuC